MSSNVITSTDTVMTDSVVDVLDHAAVFQLDSMVWSGTKAVVDPSKHLDIPKDLHSGVSKYIFDKKWLQPFESIRAHAKGHANKFGTKFCKHNTIFDRDLIVELRPLLDELKLEWAESLDALGDSYEERQEEYRESQSVHGDQWIKFIQESELSWKEVKTKFRFEYLIFTLDTRNLDVSASHSISDAKNNLYTDISGMARVTLDRLVKADSCSQKMRGSINRKFVTKLRRVAFLDNKASALADYCEEFSETFPTHGDIVGSDFNRMKLFFKSLIDARDITAIVGSVKDPAGVIKALPKVKAANAAEAEEASEVDPSQTASTEEQLELPEATPSDSSGSDSNKKCQPTTPESEASESSPEPEDSVETAVPPKDEVVEESIKAPPGGVDFTIKF